MNAPESESESEDRPRFRPVVLVPLAGFLVLAAIFCIPLFKTSYDASRLPSALIGKDVPAFSLVPVDGLGKPGLATADLRKGRVTLVNVFASWCIPCHEEAPALLLLARSGIPIVGIAYKDKPENTRRFLSQDGDPYAAVGADVSGRTGIDFGVYGVPETYVVRGDGTITSKIVGPLTEDNIRDKLMPAIAAAKG